VINIGSLEVIDLDFHC